MNKTLDLIYNLQKARQVVNEDWTDSLQKLMDARNEDPERFDNPRIAKFDNIVNDISNATGVNISIDDEDVDERIGSFVGMLIKLTKELDSERYEGALEYLR